MLKSDQRKFYFQQLQIMKEQRPNMSESSINHGNVEEHVHLPTWRTLINLAIAVVSPTLALIPVWLLMIPLWLALGALSYFAPPGILQKLADAALTAVTVFLYLGGAAAFGVGISFVILGIPTAILGWRLGRITWRSSMIAGFLIGCLPYLLILPFDQSFGPNYPSTSAEILKVAGDTVTMGAFGAFEGILFWCIWRFLSRRKIPTRREADDSTQVEIS
jgi:hypothetical protein